MSDSDEIAALRLTLARLVEGQSSALKELAELRAALASSLKDIDQELLRHREAEATQGDVVKAYAASLEADRKALAEIKATRAEGRAGLLLLLADQRVIGALITIVLGIAAYLAGASNGAPPPVP